MGESAGEQAGAETIRQPETGSTRQPQERQHSGAKGGRGIDCLRRGVPSKSATGSSPYGRDANPVHGISTAARGAERVEPGPQGAPKPTPVRHQRCTG